MSDVPQNHKPRIAMSTASSTTVANGAVGAPFNITVFAGGLGAIPELDRDLANLVDRRR